MAFTDTLDAKGKEQGWQGSPSFLWVGRDEEEMWIWRREPPSAPGSHLTLPLHRGQDSSSQVFFSLVWEHCRGRVAGGGMGRHRVQQQSFEIYDF